MKDKILTIPSLLFFDNSWDYLQKFLKSKGNPPWKCKDDLYLYKTQIKSLGNLVAVGGDLNLFETPIISLGNLRSVGAYLDLERTRIKSLGNLQSVGSDLSALGVTSLNTLGNLQSVGGRLDLRRTSIESFGNLQSVGGNLNLRNTPVSIKYTEEEIRQKIKIGGKIYK